MASFVVLPQVQVALSSFATLSASSAVFFRSSFSCLFYAALSCSSFLSIPFQM
jgi:hypothetical protein